MAPLGVSCATPPGRMKALFIRSPVISSMIDRIRSRSRKPTVITVVAPISMPPVASATRCEEIRVQLHHQHADDRGPLGDLVGDAEQLLDAEAVGRLLEHRREVVHAGAERDPLGPRPELHVLLDPGVQVADARAGLGHRLAVDLEDQPEHAVGRGVLRTHVDDDPLLAERGRLVDDVVPVAAEGVDHMALGGALLGRDAVGVTVGCLDERLVLLGQALDQDLGLARLGVLARARAGCRGQSSVVRPPLVRRWDLGALVLHRDATERVVLALRVARPVVRHQDPGQRRVAVEDDAEEVPGLALVPVVAAGRSRRSTGCAGRCPAPTTSRRIRRPPLVIESRW